MSHASEVLEEIGYCNLKQYKNTFIEVSLQAGSLHSVWKGDTMKFPVPNFNLLFRRKDGEDWSN